MILIALIVGFGLTYLALVDGRFVGAYHLTPWTAWPQAGTPDPDPYTKAFVARNNALPLGSSEGIEFIATRDSSGQLLQRNCSYRLSGNMPVASFWTLRAAAVDGAGITPPGAVQNIQSNRLTRKDNGEPAIFIGPKLSAENWLEIEGEGAFDVILTLYDASVFAGFGDSVDELPQIISEGCS